MSPPVGSTQPTHPAQLPEASARPADAPQSGTPEQNAAWWSGLSPQEQANYLEHYGNDVGGMDGLPSDVRHEANVEVLRADAAGGDQAAKDLLDRIENSRLGPMKLSEHLYLLDYTPADSGSLFRSKTDAQAVVAISNPDAADNVAVFVPGTGSNVGNIHDNIDRMDALKAQSELVGGSTSTIVWLGYDAPDNVVSARGPDATAIGPALDGAPALRDFTHGLRASRQGDDPANLTVIGHSYGSTVVGYADQTRRGDGLGADNIIVAGSPGLGGVRSVDELNIDNDSFWALMADDDEIRFGTIHGTNPVNESFGGQRLANGEASGHSDYWKADIVDGSLVPTESLRNQAYIVSGNEHMVTTREHR